MTGRLAVAAAFAVLIVSLAAWSLILLALGEHVAGLVVAAVAVAVGAARLAWTHRQVRLWQRRREEEQP